MPDVTTPPTPPSPQQAAVGGRRSGETRRRQTAREIAQAATQEAIRDLLTNPPPLSQEQRDRLRVILGTDEPAR